MMLDNKRNDWKPVFAIICLAMMMSVPTFADDWKQSETSFWPWLPNRPTSPNFRWPTRTFSSDTFSRRPESSAYRSSTGSVCAHPTRPG